MMRVASSILLLSLCVLSAFGIQPNPPKWPEDVYVFDPADSANTQKLVDSIAAQQGGHNPPNNGQFSPDRYALLFKPGYHNVTVNVGYYTSVIGLGGSPKDVNIREVTCQNGDFDYTTGALDTFWRSAENFYTKPTTYWNDQGSPSMLWAVSQAAPLRRVYVDGNLNLYQFNYGCCAGYASGGYMSNSYVAGEVNSGSQQQWLTRNSYFGDWSGGSWNMVYVGCSGGVPADQCTPFVSAASAPLIAEKPFITISDSGLYSLAVPPVETNKVGPSNWDNGGLENHRIIDFSNVFVASPYDQVSTINSMLDQGIHVVLAPGQYNLTDTIVINKPDMVVLGIGFPTLISATGKPCLQVGSVDGVRVGGILFQAGPVNTETLLSWGSKHELYPGNPSNPSFVYDLYARVGGPNDQTIEQVSANHMSFIYSGNVVIDGSWMWRADHGVAGLVYNGDNPCQTGIVVEGSNVTAYGLAVEHTLGDLVQWYGDNGQVFFYQSELPYDVNATYGQLGYTSYRVASSVVTHHAMGVGAYSFFRDFSVYVESGFKMESPYPTVQLQQAFTVFLNGNGGIEHVVNNEGGSATGTTGAVPLCSYP